MESIESKSTARPPWNKGKIVGQKAPFKLKEIWAIRVRLQLASRRRELALFNLAIDSKLRLPRGDVRRSGSSHDLHRVLALQISRFLASPDGSDNFA